MGAREQPPSGFPVLGPAAEEVRRARGTGSFPWSLRKGVWLLPDPPPLFAEPERPWFPGDIAREMFPHQAKPVSR